VHTINGKTLTMAALVFSMASVSAWAAEPASLFRTGRSEFTIALDAKSKGKIKIYEEKPVYDDDNNLEATPSKVAELKIGTNFTSYKLKKGRDYYIIFFPYRGQIDVTANLYADTKNAPATLKVKKLVLPIVGSMAFKASLESGGANNKIFSFDENNFEAYDGSDPAWVPKVFFQLP